MICSVRLELVQDVRLKCVEVVALQRLAIHTQGVWFVVIIVGFFMQQHGVELILVSHTILPGQYKSALKKGGERERARQTYRLFHAPAGREISINRLCPHQHIDNGKSMEELTPHGPDLIAGFTHSLDAARRIFWLAESFVAQNCAGRLRCDSTQMFTVYLFRLHQSEMTNL